MNRIDELRDRIREYKYANGIVSPNGNSAIPYQNKHMIARGLLDHYKKLAFESQDVSVWDEFFKEPLIRNLVSEQVFRKWIWVSVPVNSGDYERISLWLRDYKKPVFLNLLSPEEKAKALKLRKKYNITGGVLAVLAGICVFAFVCLKDARELGYSEYLSLIFIVLAVAFLVPALVCLNKYNQYI